MEKAGMNFDCARWLRSVSWFVLFLLFFSLNAHASHKAMPDRIAALVAAANEKGMLSGEGAVILKKQISISATESGECLLKKEIIGIVLDKKAASDYSQITYVYNEHYENVRLDYARTYAGERDALDVSQDAVQIKTPPSLNSAKSYSDFRILTFSLPGMAPDTVFEYRITEKYRPVIQGDWAYDINFHAVSKSLAANQLPRLDAVLQSRVVVDAPDSQHLVYDLSNAALDPSVKKEKNRILYTWTMENLEKIELESGMPTPDRVIPTLRISSIDTWDKVDQWAFDRFLPNITANQAIETLVHKITGGATDRSEKIKMVYKYVQSNIEYVMADYGRSGYRPHPAGDVLQNGYGDCKDKTALVIAMLKVLGVEAYPALLVPFPFSDVNRKVPTYFFNHAIVFIPQPAGDLWIDTTSNSRFDSLPWPDQDRLAFIIDGRGGRFAKTPLLPFKANQGSIKTTYRFDTDHYGMDVEITASGAIGDALKDLFSNLSPQQTKHTIQTWTRQLYPDRDVLSVKRSDMKDSDLDFKLKIVARSNKNLGKNNDVVPFGFGISPALSFFTPLLVLAPPESRRYDFQSGFAYQVSAQSICSPPDSSYALELLPEVEKIDSGSLSYHTQFNKANGSVNVRSTLEIKKPVIMSSEYAGFYEQIRKIRTGGKQILLFKKQKVDEKTLALERKLEDHPDDIKKKLALSKRYLKTGKYEEANRILEKAVEEDKTNGELYYYLGIAMGYLGQYDRADEAIQKSEELGFFP